MKSRNGFTLVELLIVFAVMGIMSIIGFASLVSYSRAQTVNTTAQDLTTAFNVAKQRAFSQVKPETDPRCDASKSLEGYKVVFCKILGAPCLQSEKDGGYDYVVYPMCSGFPASPILKQKVPSQVSISSKKACITSSSYFFSSINNGVTGAGYVTISGFGQSKKVAVDSIGNITVSTGCKAP